MANANTDRLKNEQDVAQKRAEYRRPEFHVLAMTTKTRGKINFTTTEISVNSGSGS